MKKFLCKIAMGIGSIFMMAGLLIFGLIFIFAPNLAANLGLRYVELAAD